MEENEKFLPTYMTVLLFIVLGGLLALLGYNLGYLIAIVYLV